MTATSETSMAPASQPSSSANSSSTVSADVMAHSTRTPILRWPNEYGLEYEDVFFPALDGVTLEINELARLGSEPCSAVARRQRVRVLSISR
jgi:hypothetical protein